MKRLIVLLMMLGACREQETVLPQPVALTPDATGHLCMMVLGDHAGPKAQIHLEGYPAPIFFSQVRDALAYVKGSDREASILAVYVSDMAVAPDWETPGNDNWILADKASFVVGADVLGGMGVPEIVPFGTHEAAERFAQEQGGAAMTLEQIPAETVLAPVVLDLLEEVSQ